MAYRNYVADALMILTENTDRALSTYRHMVKQYNELITDKPKEKKDTRTGEEIAADIVKKIAKKG